MPKKNTTDKVNLNLKIDKTMSLELDIIAKYKGVYKSDLVVAMLRKEIELEKSAGNLDYKLPDFTHRS